MDKKPNFHTAVQKPGGQQNGANTPTMPKRPPMPSVKPPKPAGK